MSTSVSSTRLRITGMASGLDVDSTIKSLMKAERARQDKLKQQETYLEWTRDAYREQITNIKGFYNKYFDVLSSNSVINESVFSGYDTKISTGTSATVTAASGAKAGSYKIDVVSLASAASSVGTTTINAKQMSTGLPPVTIKSGQNDELVINGTTINIAEGTYTASNLAAAVNTKINADAGLKDNVIAAVDSTGKNVKLQSVLKINSGDATRTFTIDLGDGNGAKTLTLDTGTYSMDTLASQINSKLSAAGINSSKVKAEAEADGMGIKFTNSNGTSIIVDGTTIADGTSATNNKYDKNFTLAVGAQAYKPNVDGANSILGYDKVISAGFGNNTLSIKLGSSAIENLNLADIDIPYGSTESAGWDSVVTAINNAITANVNLNGKISAQKSADGTGLVFKSTVPDQVTISGSASTALGIGSSANFSMNLNEKAANILGAVNTSFSVNGVSFSYNLGTTDASKTLSDIIADVETKASVDISYSELTKKFSISSKTTGASQTITASDTAGSFVSQLFGGAVNATGTDAQVKITEPGQAETTINQSSNNFALDGISYSLSATGVTEFSVGGDSSKIVDKIKDFITQYNTLVQNINDKLTEKKQYSYSPLTDDQKESMKDTEIEKWETKAKEGILSNDSDLQSMLSKMRIAIYDNVKDAGISLSELGISTSSDLSKSGQLVLDETKLKSTIEKDPDKVMNIFIKKSTSQSRYIPNDSTDPSAITNRGIRYNEEGIFQRISDIMQDYTRTYNGKGTLLKKSGYKGDSTEANNTISSRIKEKLKAISDMEEKLADKENNYYTKFSKLESYMNQMNSQQSWLQAQLSSM